MVCQCFTCSICRKERQAKRRKLDKKQSINEYKLERFTIVIIVVMFLLVIRISCYGIFFVFFSVLISLSLNFHSDLQLLSRTTMRPTLVILSDVRPAVKILVTPDLN